MKIDGVTNNYAINPYKNYNKASVDKAKESTDTLEISEEAMNLLSEGSEVRNEKIESIKNQIAEGSYHRNSTDVVDKMIQNVISDKKQ